MPSKSASLRLRLALLAILSLPGAGSADDKPRPKPQAKAPTLAEQVEAIREQHGLPGLAYLYTHNGKIVEQGATGLRKARAEPRFEQGDLVHIGSCTKAMTAVLLATLVEEGKLKWSSTLADVFPDSSDKIHEKYRTVTLDMLTRHRAGLPRGANFAWLKGDTDTQKRESLIVTVLSQPPVHEPGTKYQYSNVGYALAGLAAEQVTGQSWRQLMRKRLFQPLKMKSAGFGAPGTPGQIDQPWGHRSLALLIPDQFDNPPALGPAGTVHCTLADWAKFANLFSDAGRRNNPLLKADALAEQVQLTEGDYARGWMVLKRGWSEGQAYTHSGSNTRWYSTVWMSPKLNLVFLTSVNCGGSKAAQACDEAVVAMLRHAKRIE